MPEGARGGREGSEGGITKDQKRLLGLQNMFIILFVVKASQVYTHVKTYQVVHFKYVQFIVCRLYLNKDVKSKVHAD